MSARRIRVHPTREDAEVLKRWMGLYRRYYNRTVHHCETTKTYSYPAVRGAMTNEASVPASEHHLSKLPVSMRKYAVKDATQAFVTNFSRRKRDPSHSFRVSFRTKKASPAYLKLESRLTRVRDVDGKPRLFLGDARDKQLSSQGIAFFHRHADVLRDSKDSILRRDDRGRFWLIAIVSRAPETQGGDRGVVALDPGVRTFQTTYSPDGEAYKLGDGAACRIYRLMLHSDALAGQAAKRGASRKVRERLRAKRARIESRVNGLVDELHWKVARFLCGKYAVVIIPPFETAKMSRRYEISRAKRRTIGRKTTRQMSRLRHYAFRQRLIHVASSAGTEVVVETEEYTSKTCGSCGTVHPKLGGSKIFRCPSCCATIDRDVNGARNIYVKACALRGFAR